MKVLYIGCVESSYVFLETMLHSGIEVVGVITKSYSGINSDFVDLSDICIKYNIRYCYFNKMDEDEVISFIEKTGADIGCCFGWSHLLSERILNSVEFGFIGFHPANLPNNRGRHPIIWALVLGLEQTASTFFVIDKTADTGDIVSQVVVNIEKTDNARSLMDKVLAVGKKQVIELLQQYDNGTVQYIRQNPNDGNVWRKRGKLDGQIDWRMPSLGIYNLVRALTKPYVGAHFLKEDVEVKVWEIEIISISEGRNIEPGKVYKIDDDGKPIIKTGDGFIKLLDYETISLRNGEYL